MDLSVNPHQQAGRLCEECQKPLYGRVDQRFCNDTCRNAYNRHKRKFEETTEPQFVRQIVNVLKRNHRILRRFNHGQDNPKVSRQELIEAGFSFKFFTSIYKTQNGDIYHYVFEQGWLEISESKVLLVVNYDQTEV